MAATPTPFSSMVAACASGTLVARCWPVQTGRCRDPVQEIVLSFLSKLPSRQDPNTINTQSNHDAMSLKSKKKRTTKTTRRATASGAAHRSPGQGINLLMHPDAAGIDVGAEEFVAAVPTGRGGANEPDVRTFTSFTSGVMQLRDWLLACGIKTVAMESTGNYWITLHDTLAKAGIDVYLVNARHVKGVPGKKTDVCDAQWLQQLHAAGLLKKSFRPAQDIVPLRFLMRHRSEMIADAAKHLQLMQKTLTELNLKIHHVFSDIDGVSAQAIIDAILAGERDPVRLAALRDRRCRRPVAEIIEALRGDFRPEYLFVLRQSQQTWKQLLASIKQCDEEIEALSAKVACVVSPLLTEGSEKQPEITKKLNKNSPQYPIFDEARRFYGVDLSAIPGVGAGLLAVLMSEVGTRDQLMAAFRSASAFCSWMGLCPDNRVSGGKVLKAKTRKIPSRVARALRLGIFGLQNSATKLGKAEGLTAAAHKLCRIIYGVIATQRAYNENEAFKITPQSAARRRRILEKQAAALGLQLTPAA
jgi:transposase